MNVNRRREVMVRRHLIDRGIADPAVLDAFRTVPRERFVDTNDDDAYEDRPLPIGGDQTISQPYVVAIMVEALEIQPTDHVLEVGAGSGYAAAILSLLARDVVAVERLPTLATAAAAILAELGYTNVRIVAGDGSMGMADDAPFDAICVSASAPAVPPALVEQLAPGGRMIVPVGPSDHQDLVRVRRLEGDQVREERFGAVRFVPLLGEQGWRR